MSLSFNLPLEGESGGVESVEGYASLESQSVASHHFHCSLLSPLTFDFKRLFASHQHGNDPSLSEVVTFNFDTFFTLFLSYNLSI